MGGYNLKMSFLMHLAVPIELYHNTPRLQFHFCEVYSLRDIGLQILGCHTRWRIN